jgi:hypothetical protein
VGGEVSQVPFTNIGLADDATELQQTLQSFLEHHRYHVPGAVTDAIHEAAESLDDVIDMAVVRASLGQDQAAAW